MDAEPKELHVAIFPFVGHGHMIPFLHLARLFTRYNGVKVTIITNTYNAPFFNKSIKYGIDAPNINIELFRFPAQEVGLSVGIERLVKNVEQMLQMQLEQYLNDVRPNCLIADMFFPWATTSAAKFNIPRLVFHGTGSFSLCALEIVSLHKPFENVSSDTELVVLPFLPNEIKFTRLQIPATAVSHTEGETESDKMTRRIRESELEGYGVIVNSFYELEPDYADFFRKHLRRRAWNIGPVSLGSTNTVKKSQSGNQASINEHDCLQWLASKKPHSVIYICFGSGTKFTTPQLHEIVMALEASGKEFIWVVRKISDEKSEEWLPTGFEQRTKGKGLLLRDWAPQVQILEHEAIGAFVTHCGWSSILEAVSAGVPMVTWPVFAEQFYNEKLVTHILKTGIPVGTKKWSRKLSIEDIVKREAIENALKEIMVGNGVDERRARAKELKKMAQKAVEEGGSSHSDLSALINELRNISDRKISKS